MLEHFKEGLEYKKMSQDEMAARGILGRLVGKCADIMRPTRNGRKYNDVLWEKCFSDPVVKEQYAAGGIFGELTHPDREEVDMEKIAIIMPEPPKKGDDGYLWGEWHILDTPCGRILKTLCDYGYKVGISTRGSGEVEENYDGTEDVVPDSYSLSALDIVLVPAVKEARLEYMTESLEKKKYNKTLRSKLQESLDKASESDKKIMEEALDDIGLHLTEDVPMEEKDVILQEDDLHDVFRKDAKDQYKRYSNKVDAWNKKADEYRDLGIDPELAKNLAGKKPGEFKLQKGSSKLERKNYPFYVTFYEGTSYYHPEEGGYYVAGLEPYYSEGFNSFDEAQDELVKYLEENGSAKVSFNPNLPVNDDNYTYSEDEEEYRPYYDSKNRLIGAVASGKYIGEEEQIWIETNKQYLKKRRGDSMYESLSEDWSHDKYDELMKKGKDNWDQSDWEAYHYIMQTWSEYGYFDESLNEDNKALQKDQYNLYSGAEFTSKTGHKIWIDGVQSSFSPYDGSPYVSVNYHYKTVDGKEGESSCNTLDLFNMLKEGFKPSNKVNNIAVDNNEAMVEELQNLLTKNTDLEEQIIELQEKLSVCYAKESRTEEKIRKYESSIEKLSESRKAEKALTEKLNSVQNQVKLLTEQKKDAESRLDTYSKMMKKSSDNKRSLKESLSAKEAEFNDLLEERNKLEESLRSLSKDNEISKKQYVEKLQKSNKLVEKYKSVAKKAVDKYIDSQANILGVKSDEIKNRLPESYSFEDIDAACKDVKQYRVSVGKLPFVTTLNENKENVRMSAKASKNDPLANLSGLDDEVDSQLLQLAGIQ